MSPVRTPPLGSGEILLLVPHADTKLKGLGVGEVWKPGGTGHEPVVSKWGCEYTGHKGTWPRRPLGPEAPQLRSPPGL